MSPGMIVLAEDNDKLRKLYTDFLEFHGYTVAAARNGVEAICLLGSITPKVLILDIMMPSLNGIETCRQARTILGGGVPIVFLTAADNLATLRDGMHAGGNDYLIKSEKLDQILDRIKYWTAARSRRDMQLRRAKVQKQVEEVVRAHEEEVVRAHEESVLAGALLESGDAIDSGDGVSGTRETKTTVGPSDETEETVRDISRFIAVARAHLPKDFGTTAEQKRILLGYTAGVVSHWTESENASKSTFFDYLGAVLTETKLLMPGEISRMIGSFDELSAERTFKTASVRGQHDCIESEHEGTGFVPMGLAKIAAAVVTKIPFFSRRTIHRKFSKQKFGR